MTKDYYKILGVQDKATDKEIKEAYRRLAKKYHPDKTRGNKKDEDRFKDISEAYSVLSNPERRKKYDQMRHMGTYQGGDASGFDYESIFGNGHRGSWKRSSSGFDFSSIFGDMFGGFGGQHTGTRDHSRRGQDATAELTVPFDVAAKGGKQIITLNQQHPCEHCQGQGVDLSSGQICTACGGRGTIPRSKKISVTIPPGTGEGHKIRLKNLGHPGVGGGPKGDLMVTIHVADHPVFRRKGLDLFVDQDINMVQAALGTRISVRTYDGKTVNVTVPEGTQNGRQLRLSGLGLKNASGQTGHLYVVINITVPKHLSKKSKDSLKAFARSAGLEI
jgi:molecular chaperone DnaJ